MKKTDAQLLSNLYVNRYGEFCFDVAAFGGYYVRRIITGIHSEAMIRKESFSKDYFNSIKFK